MNDTHDGIPDCPRCGENDSVWRAGDGVNWYCDDCGVTFRDGDEDDRGNDHRAAQCRLGGE